MDVNQNINNPSNMTGIFTKDGIVQGKNADEVLQIVKALQPSPVTQVVNEIVGLAFLGLVFWGGYKVCKSYQKHLENEDE